MGKATGFLEYEREVGRVLPERERIRNFYEFHASLGREKQREQAARCMACGVPFCQYGGMIGGMASGCPLHNLIPETNDLVYVGNWKQAYRRLSKTHPFPEFTSRVCPALCEAACTCNLNGEPVSTKENERAIIETAFREGWVSAQPPRVRSGKRVAIVGSGPAGLAAAEALNRRGHSVTVYERRDRIGGLLRYGIPNMKLEKKLIDRRVALMREEGVEFIVSTDVGRDIPAKELTEAYDAVVLCTGASQPRDITVPGRDAEGVYFAVDFLSRVTKTLLDTGLDEPPYELARQKRVLVIGGGDTGNDCVGTVIRLGAAGVTQLEMMPCPPEERAADNPWPEWPRVKKTDYGQEEAIALYGHDPRVYQTTVKELIKDKKGRLKEAVLIRLDAVRDPKSGRIRMSEVAGSEERVPCELALIAAGFLGSESYVTDAFGVETDARSNIRTAPGQYQSSADRIFTAGDAHRGQSLVVWAIREGREAARAVDEALMGYSYL